MRYLYIIYQFINSRKKKQIILLISTNSHTCSRNVRDKSYNRFSYRFVKIMNAFVL